MKWKRNKAPPAQHDANKPWWRACCQAALWCVVAEFAGQSERTGKGGADAAVSEVPVRDAVVIQPRERVDLRSHGGSTTELGKVV